MESFGYTSARRVSKLAYTMGGAVNPGTVKDSRPALVRSTRVGPVHGEPEPGHRAYWNLVWDFSRSETRAPNLKSVIAPPSMARLKSAVRAPSLSLVSSGPSLVPLRLLGPPTVCRAGSAGLTPRMAA